jgi:hypothetical protein
MSTQSPISPAAAPHQRPPVQRAFAARLAGSPFAGPAARTRHPDKSDVLLHYCFDQQRGETKKEHCFCEERAVRVSREVAEEYVTEGTADWLRVKNARYAKGFSEFHRAIVIRSEVVDGERLFKVPSPWTDSRPYLPAQKRQEKHEYIKAKIRGEARGILTTLFRKGVLAQDQFNAYQDDRVLDEVFENPTKLDALLKFLTDQGQHKLRRQFHDKVIHWWNNILGYLRADEAQGQYMVGAPHGQGAINYAGDCRHVELIEGKHETDTGRVGPANHKPSFWCGTWDHSKGRNPNVDETEEDRTERIIREHDRYERYPD